MQNTQFFGLGMCNEAQEIFDITSVSLGLIYKHTVACCTLATRSFAWLLLLPFIREVHEFRPIKYRHSGGSSLRTMQEVDRYRLR
jgi:hypothetical protein